MAVRANVRPPARPGAVAKALAGQRNPRISPGMIATMGPKRPAQAGPVPGISTLRGALSQPPIPAHATALQQAAQPPAPAAPTAQPAGPQAGGLNPYTHKPLAANEYVGVAGSEAEHPGMVRIPPPGWWDPSNPNYERRAYYHDASGNTVAIEPGYYGDPAHPYDTGRPGERNTELPPGLDITRYDQPGVPTWGPSDQKPAMPSYSRTAAPAQAAQSLLASIVGQNPFGTPGQTHSLVDVAQDPAGQLSNVLAALAGKTPQAPRVPRQRGPQQFVKVRPGMWIQNRPRSRNANEQNRAWGGRAT